MEVMKELYRRANRMRERENEFDVKKEKVQRKSFT